MNKKFISISLVTHIFLLIMLITSFQLTHHTVNEQPEQQFIASQLINSAPIFPGKTKHIAEQILSPVKASAASAATKTEPVPELLAMLHTAIEQAQQYPASAQEQQREGRVTLAFTLAPNGSISHSRVAASSGISSLDHAALQALHAAAPFQHINKYLHSVENYQIDVIFKLN